MCIILFKQGSLNGVSLAVHIATQLENYKIFIIIIIIQNKFCMHSKVFLVKMSYIVSLPGF